MISTAWLRRFSRTGRWSPSFRSSFSDDCDPDCDQQGRAVVKSHFELFGRFGSDLNIDVLRKIAQVV